MIMGHAKFLCITIYSSDLKKNCFSYARTWTDCGLPSVLGGRGKVCVWGGGGGARGVVRGSRSFDKNNNNKKRLKPVSKYKFLE